MHKSVLYALLELHAKSGNITDIEQVLNRCKDEQEEELSMAILVVINELVENGYSSHVDSLLPLLPGSYDLDRAIVNIIPQYVEQNRSELMITILLASDTNLQSHLGRLTKEMVYQTVSADQFNAIWHKLNSIGITIETHFEIYQPAVRSQSIELVEAILNHMYLKEILVDEKMIKNWIRLVSKKGLHHLSSVSIGLQSQLRSLGFGSRNIVFAMIKTILDKYDIDAAIEIIDKYVYDYDNDFLIEALLNAYFKSRDAANFVRFIYVANQSKMIQSKRKRFNCIQLIQTRYDFNFKIVHKIIMDDRMDDKLLDKTLREMRSNGLFISRQCFNRIATEIAEREGSSKIILMLEQISTKKPI